jgi:hypothetical protein
MRRLVLELMRGQVKYSSSSDDVEQIGGLEPNDYILQYRNRKKQVYIMTHT